MCQWNRRLIRCLLIVILLIVVLAACQNDDRPDVVVSVEGTAVSTPTAQPTHTATPTFTPSPTPTQTKTAVPTNTPTPRPTSTPTPTQFPNLLLTPEVFPIGETAYRLVPWSPDHAHNLALLMEEYHESMRVHFSSSMLRETYLYSFRYASLAYAEAQLRYPDDPRIDYWQLGRIANFVVSDDLSDSTLYQKLIIEQLNSGKLSVNELPQWFQQYPFAFMIEVDEITPLPGYKKSYIITIISEVYSDFGNATFWLLEKADGFISYQLYSNLGYPISSGYSRSIADLTGDDILDIIISASSHSGTMIGEVSTILDLSTVPPIQLGFGPQKTGFLRSSRETIAQLMPNGKTNLHISGGAPTSCPNWHTSIFHWNGQWFEQTEFKIINDDTIPEFCVFTLDEPYWQRLSEIEKTEILSWFESELGDIRPTGFDHRIGEEFAEDAQDEIRYLLAIHHAMLGHFSEAQNLLEKIITTPSVPDSQWLNPALTFLSIYQSPIDLYLACVEVSVKCNPQEAITSIAKMLPATTPSDMLNALNEIGVPTLAHGWFDFDDNRLPEKWFITRHQKGDELELWIISQAGTSIKVIYVDSIETFEPEFRIHTRLNIGYHFDATTSYIPFTIGSDQVFAFYRRHVDQEPFVVKLDRYEPYVYGQKQSQTTFWGDGSIDYLLSGGDPQELLIQLQALANSSNFEPDNRYYYHLGLTYELLGNEENAVDAYLLAWQDCCDTWQHMAGDIVTANPHAIMARAKLEPVP